MRCQLVVSLLGLSLPSLFVYIIIFDTVWLLDLYYASNFVQRQRHEIELFTVPENAFMRQLDTLSTFLELTTYWC